MKYQKGQALVLVLLSLAVVLTLVLYILSRSVTDILVSSKNEETTRAFSAAEAGIEQALVIGIGNGSRKDLGNNAGFISSVSGFATGTKSFVYPLELNSGDTMTLWLKSQDSSADFNGTKVKICWGQSGTTGNANTAAPAIEASLFYGTATTVKIFRAAFDPNTTRSSSNGFSAVNSLCTVNGTKFAFYQTLDISGLTEPQFIRIQMLYNTDTAHPIAFDSTDSSVFPSQGTDIISTGTAGTSTRRIDVFQGWPEPPSVLNFAIYSPSGLTKP